MEYSFIRLGADIDPARVDERCPVAGAERRAGKHSFCAVSLICLYFGFFCQRRRADLGAHIGKVPPVGREAAPWKPAMNSPDCEIEWIIVCNDVCTPRLTGCVFLVLSPTAAVLAL